MFSQVSWQSKASVCLRWPKATPEAWGVIMQREFSQSGCSAGNGSGFVTSRAAPHRWPLFSSSFKAAQSMNFPRPTFTIIEFFFIIFNLRESIKPAVWLELGMHHTTTSASGICKDNSVFWKRNWALRILVSSCPCHLNKTQFRTSGLCRKKML